jgi:Caenorhabditis protein of unknown function, DUF268
MKTRIRRFLAALQLSPGKTFRALWRLPEFFLAYYRYKNLAGVSEAWPLAANYPFLLDKADSGGTASGHYFHQDLLVAQRIFVRSPRVHFDVGSRIDGFVAHVAAFRTIEYFDIRPVVGGARNLSFRLGNLIEPESLPARSCDSLSCLHVIEHVGLGRYGDPLVPDGWRLAVRSLARMLQHEGLLYLSVPIGRQRIEFNAHRVFSPSTIVQAAAESGLKLEHFAWVDDEGALHDPAVGAVEIPVGMDGFVAGCGIFEFRLAQAVASAEPETQANPSAP